MAGLERFEELGLLRSEAIQIEDEGWNAYGRTKRQRPGKSFSLTSEGEAAFPF